MISKRGIKKLHLQIRYVCYNRNLFTHVNISLIEQVITKTENNIFRSFYIFARVAFTQMHYCIVENPGSEDNFEFIFIKITYSQSHLRKSVAIFLFLYFRQF